MNRAHALAALLACAAMAASGTLDAQARGPAVREKRSDQQLQEPPLVLDEVTRVTKMAEMEAWLGRLVGRFRGDFEWRVEDGKIDRLYSMAICSVIGKGAGVRCTIRMTVPGQPDPGQVNPALYNGSLPILFFGINPDTLQVQLVVVDAGTIAGRSGMLVGDRVDFSFDNWKVCHVAPWGTCWPAATVTARSSGEIFLRLTTDIRLFGRRSPQFDARSGERGNVMNLHLHIEPKVGATVP